MTASRFNPTSPARGAAPPAQLAGGAAATEERAERLVDALLGGVVYRDVTVARTKVRGRMRLLQRGEMAQVLADVRRELAERLGIVMPTGLQAVPEWRDERMVRVIAVAVRDPHDPSRPLADLEEWSTCDDGQLEALFDAYTDLEMELDPLGDNAPPLTEKEVKAIQVAAGKGERDLLMSYGSRRLALYAISSAATPSS